MRKSSWIALAVCAVLAVALGGIYLVSQSESETLTQAKATEMLHDMQSAVSHKNAAAVMKYMSPDAKTRVASLNEDQLRLLISRAFRDSGRLQADVSNISFQSTAGEATVQFDLKVTNEDPNVHSQDYAGRVTLHVQRIEVPHLLGLYRTREWRITGAESTGPDPAGFSDL